MPALTIPNKDKGEYERRSAHNKQQQTISAEGKKTLHLLTMYTFVPYAPEESFQQCENK